MTKTYKVTMMMNDGQTFNIYVEGNNVNEIRNMVETDELKVVGILY